MSKFLKPILFVVGLTFIILGFWLGFNSGIEIKNYPPKGTKILAFGDSLVLGVGGTEGNDFVSLTSRLIGLPISNFGKAGDTTGTALLRIDKVLDYSPDIVLVLLGGNDAIRRVPLKETEQNLSLIILKFQQKGALVVLIGVRGGIIGDPYDDMYERISKATSSIYIPDVLKGLFGDNRYMSDAIHPNDLGYSIIGTRISEEISKILEDTKTGVF